jgi:hypothetical protein
MILHEAGEPSKQKLRKKCYEIAQLMHRISTGCRLAHFLNPNTAGRQVGVSFAFTTRAAAVNSIQNQAHPSV